MCIVYTVYYMYTYRMYTTQINSINAQYTVNIYKYYI